MYNRKKKCDLYRKRKNTQKKPCQLNITLLTVRWYLSDNLRQSFDRNDGETRLIHSSYNDYALSSSIYRLKLDINAPDGKQMILKGCR